MRIVLITTCTNRKKSTNLDSLKASILPEGSQKSVLSAWMTILGQKSGSLPVKELYASRGAAEMRTLAKEMSAPLYFISAGLGLVDSNAIRPNYNLTTANNGENSIARKVIVGNFDPTAWWSGVNPTNPHPISALVRRNLDAVIVCAISSTYLELVKDDLESICQNDLGRLRLLGITVAPRSKLFSTVVPYDNRFNGPDSPIPGTLSDFPQRCASHFVRSILPKAGLGQDIRHARAFMETLRPSIRIVRNKASDDAILGLMQDRLGRGYISNTGMLRHLRDDLHLACEQKRCSNLYKQVRGKTPDAKQRKN